MQRETATEARTVAPYGAWTSPLTAASVAAGARRFGEVAIDRDEVYWTEGRPAEAGRVVLVRRTPDGRTLDVTPAGFSVRSRVHEYGGGAIAVHRGDVYFTNFADQKVYVQPGGGPPAPLTADGFFFADLRVDAAHGRLLAVREDHRQGDTAPPAAIVGIPLDGGGGPVTVFVSGADFYSDPVVSPDGRTLAWLQWNHPNMPWDGTELWTARVQPDGSLGSRTRVAGGPDESIFQPEWSPDGVLYFVSDRTGWWNLYRVRREADDGHRPGGVATIEPLHPMAAEFGKPQWTFSAMTYAFAGPRRIAATYLQDGRWRLAFIETNPVRWEPVPLSLDVLESIHADERAVYFIGGSPVSPPVVARMTLAAMEPEVLRVSMSDTVEPGWISRAEPVTFMATPSLTTAGSPATGPDRSRLVHGFYYAPVNPEFTAPEGSRPPLMVITHGGPTGSADTTFDPRVQFWTSRGFAVLDVNYSGSTGYGRDYRDRLKGQWGVVDVEDAVAGARAMVEQGRADAERLAIRGSSAGGYTTLAALTFHDTFKAGASYYGISDIEVLARDTHKFESRYLDTLIGPWPAARDVYRARSPIHHTDRLSAALILFQGLEDKVVPPNQSAMMAEAARARGLTVEYHTFPGEQHGFRRSETIVASLEAELAFYGRIFGFAPR